MQENVATDPYAAIQPHVASIVAKCGGLKSIWLIGSRVDANASKAHLYDVAKRLDVQGRSRMTKDELVEAIGRANDRESRKARDREAD